MSARSVTETFSRAGRFTGGRGLILRDYDEWPAPHRPRDVEVRLLKNGGAYAMRFRRTMPIEMVVAIVEPDGDGLVPCRERVLFSVSLVGQERKRTSERIVRAVEEFNAALKTAEQPTRWQRLREWLPF